MYCTLLLTNLTVEHPFLPPSQSLIKAPRSLKQQFNPILTAPRHSFSLYPQTLTPPIRCSANSDDAKGTSANWEKWLPRNIFSADKVLRSNSGATSSPISQLNSSPATFLHSVDPRIKLCAGMASCSGCLTSKVTYINALWRNRISSAFVYMDFTETCVDDIHWQCRGTLFTECQILAFVGSTRHSSPTIWDSVYNAGHRCRWRAYGCPAKNATTFHDGIAKSSKII